ncbi:hypothetical protein K3148_03085 [Qipengyuania aurantiaca]|uniref:DUF1488 family protein n=1 Tax=Qipengyuania aurantiaca TaxID=2867233 RepID=A0ABX8ZQJ7_9SPHN|nr:hypothetical protein [Qipengyuania aurantiaca]QZD91290.1 hypothetical protein K3148_03085 [Qipengyuania aurantiaca]
MHFAIDWADGSALSFGEIKAESVGRSARAFAKVAGQEYAEMCDKNGVAQLPDASDAEIESDIRVPILSGGLDVQTP